ncbi:glycosyltransferase family 2 protein [Histidinibacterium aquaticum]|uniref:glycosyltransferase family 2 protein n=1 Tax=Histidinibacterium aquaticum TaxID=2613962 RepID=UPI00168AE9D8|nr:glycosyltransferase [Histidinibacterium aquaticum]
MSDGPSVSVVVVSHGRPDSLTLCLRALVQQVYDPFEIVVVACKAGRRRIDTRPELYNRVKVVAFDERNISQGRNLGIAEAAGEVVAFIDDDAMAEPLWLHHLAPVFLDDRVGAATGYVRGRNGISFQHRLTDVGPEADSRPVRVKGDEPRLIAPPDGRGIKTEGTNMAFRRDLLLELQGFDPAYRFYLDETDLNLRLAEQGILSAVAPLAQVHHGVASSPRRRTDRVPESLFDVGASLAYFLRRHSLAEDYSPAGRAERRRRQRSLIGHMIDGRIEPRDVNRILATFDEGWAEGMGREMLPLPGIEPSGAEFLAYRADLPRLGHAVVAGRTWQARSRRAEALRLSEAGYHVTAMLLSPTARYHRAWFDAEGYWVQRGGLFGRSVRQAPLIRIQSFGKRVRAEVRRLSSVRGPARNGPV